MKKKDRKLHRAAKGRILPAAVCLLCHILTVVFPPGQMLYAGQESILPANPLPSDLSVIPIPPHLGRIEEVFKGNGGKVIFLVQDAHAIPEAQENIYKTISFFRREYGIAGVALEGASGLLDPQFFRSFPDKELLRQTLKAYESRGELPGGVTAAALDQGAVYQGAEDWDLLEEGLSLYLLAREKAPAILNELAEEKTRLAEKKKEIFPPVLYSVHEALERFYEETAAFPETLQKLSAVLPPESENLLLILKESGDKIEPSRALEQELSAIKSAAAARLEKERTREAKEVLKILNEQYQAFRTSQMDMKQYALSLRKILQELNIPVKVSKDLKKMTTEQAKLSAIRGTEFFDDFERYAAKVMRALITGPEQLELYEKFERRRFLEQMTQLELTRDAWERLRKMPEIRNDSRFAVHRLFYENAEKRDLVLLENALAMAKPAGGGEAGAAILVAGGFHAKGIAERLKAKDISYAVLMPSIERLPPEINYRGQMEGKVSWSGYLEEEENGSISLYKAFVRQTRDRLVMRKEPGREGARIDGEMVKRWRDQIIRDLADQGRAAEAGNYTRFLDELRSGSARGQDAKKLYEKAEIFAGELKRLNASGQLTQTNILNLLSASGIPAKFANAALLAPQSYVAAAPYGPSLVQKISTTDFRAGEVFRETPSAVEAQRSAEISAGPFLQETLPGRSELREMTLPENIVERIAGLPPQLKSLNEEISAKQDRARELEYTLIPGAEKRRWDLLDQAPWKWQFKRREMWRMQLTRMAQERSDLKRQLDALGYEEIKREYNGRIKETVEGILHEIEAYTSGKQRLIEAEFSGPALELALTLLRRQRHLLIRSLEEAYYSVDTYYRTAAFPEENEPVLEIDFDSKEMREAWDLTAKSPLLIEIFGKEVLESYKEKALNEALAYSKGENEADRVKLLERLMQFTLEDETLMGRLGPAVLLALWMRLGTFQDFLFRPKHGLDPEEQKKSVIYEYAAAMSRMPEHLRAGWPESAGRFMELILNPESYIAMRHLPIESLWQRMKQDRSLYEDVYPRLRSGTLHEVNRVENKGYSDAHDFVMLLSFDLMAYGDEAVRAIGEDHAITARMQVVVGMNEEILRHLEGILKDESVPHMVKPILDYVRRFAHLKEAQHVVRSFLLKYLPAYREVLGEEKYAEYADDLFSGILRFNYLGIDEAETRQAAVIAGRDPQASVEAAALRNTLLNQWLAGRAINAAAHSDDREKDEWQYFRTEDVDAYFKMAPLKEKIIPLVERLRKSGYAYSALHADQLIAVAERALDSEQLDLETEAAEKAFEEISGYRPWKYGPELLILLSDPDERGSFLEKFRSFKRIFPELEIKIDNYKPEWPDPAKAAISQFGMPVFLSRVLFQPELEKDGRNLLKDYLREKVTGLESGVEFEGEMLTLDSLIEKIMTERRFRIPFYLEDYLDLLQTTAAQRQRVFGEERFTIDTAQAGRWGYEQAAQMSISEYLSPENGFSGHFAIHQTKDNLDLLTAILQSGFVISTRVYESINENNQFQTLLKEGKVSDLIPTEFVHFSVGQTVHYLTSPFAFVYPVEALLENQGYTLDPFAAGFDWAVGGLSANKEHPSHRIPTQAGIFLFPESRRGELDGIFQRIEAVMPSWKRPGKIFYYKGQTAQEGLRELKETYAPSNPLLKEPAPKVKISRRPSVIRRMQKGEYKGDQFRHSAVSMFSIKEPPQETALQYQALPFLRRLQEVEAFSAKLEELVLETVETGLPEGGIYGDIQVSDTGSSKRGTYQERYEHFPDDFDLMVKLGGEMPSEQDLREFAKTLSASLKSQPWIKAVFNGTEDFIVKPDPMPVRDMPHGGKLVKLKVFRGDDVTIPVLSVDVVFFNNEELSDGIRYQERMAGKKSDDSAPGYLDLIVSRLPEEQRQEGKQHILSTIRTLKALFKNAGIYTRLEAGLRGVGTEQLVIQLNGTVPEEGGNFGRPVPAESLDQLISVFGVPNALRVLENAMFNGEAYAGLEGFKENLPLWDPGAIKPARLSGGLTEQSLARLIDITRFAAQAENLKTIEAPAEAGAPPLAISAGEAAELYIKHASGEAQRSELREMSEIIFENRAQVDLFLEKFLEQIRKAEAPENLQGYIGKVQSIIQDLAAFIQADSHAENETYVIQPGASIPPEIHGRAAAAFKPFIERLIVYGKLPYELQQALEEAGIEKRKISSSSDLNSIQNVSGEGVIPVIFTDLGEAASAAGRQNFFEIGINYEKYAAHDADYYDRLLAVMLSYTIAHVGTARLSQSDLKVLKDAAAGKGGEPVKRQASEIKAALLSELNKISDFSSLVSMDQGRADILMNRVQEFVTDYRAAEAARASA